MAEISVQAPYEALAIALVRLFQTVIESQPPEVRAELWKMYVEDLKAWREFWARLVKPVMNG